MPRELPDSLEGALEHNFENELITRFDRFSESRIVDRDEIESRVVVRNDVDGLECQNAGRLSQRFDDD